MSAEPSPGATSDRSVAEALGVSGSVAAGASIVIPTQVQSVWDAIVDIGAWSSWYHSIKDMRLKSSSVQVGSKFSFKTGPATISAVVEEASAPNRFRFTGRSTGSITTYAFQMESDGDLTSVRAAQSMGGLATRTMRPVLQKVADNAVVGWLDALAVHVGED